MQHFRLVFLKKPISCFLHEAVLTFKGLFRPIDAHHFMNKTVLQSVALPVAAPK